MTFPLVVVVLAPTMKEKSREHPRHTSCLSCSLGWATDHIKPKQGSKQAAGRRSP